MRGTDCGKRSDKISVAAAAAGSLAVLAASARLQDHLNFNRLDVELFACTWRPHARYDPLHYSGRAKGSQDEGWGLMSPWTWATMGDEICRLDVAERPGSIEN